MTWQEKKEAGETENPKSQDLKSSIKILYRLKKLFLKYRWLHFWSIPVLFFISFLSYFVVDTEWYYVAYSYISEIYGYSLHSCVVLFAISVLFNGCVWHYASIFGMATHNILNIVFADDEYDLYRPYKLISLSIWSIIIIGFMIYEEVYRKPSN